MCTLRYPRQFQINPIGGLQVMRPPFFLFVGQEKPLLSFTPTFTLEKV